MNSPGPSVETGCHSYVVVDEEVTETFVAVAVAVAVVAVAAVVFVVVVVVAAVVAFAVAGDSMTASYSETDHLPPVVLVHRERAVDADESMIVVGGCVEYAAENECIPYTDEAAVRDAVHPSSCASQ